MTLREDPRALVCVRENCGFGKDLVSGDRCIIEHGLGGLAPGFASIVTGPTGSGRTVLTLELAFATLARGDHVAFVTGEPARLLLQQANAMNMDFEPAIRSGQLALLELDPSVATTARNHGGDAFYDAIAESCPDAKLVIIDDIEAITTEILDEVAIRALVRALFDRTTAAGQLLVATIETSALDQNPQLARVLKGMCGSLVELSHGQAEGSFVLRVAKSRAAGFISGDLSFRIASNGPIREEEPSQPPAAEPPAVARDAPSEAPPPVSTPAPQAEPDSAAPGAATRRILIVEDDRLTRTMFSDFLEDKYEITTAEDGFTAIKKALSIQPDLVVLDLQLPRVSGFEVLSALREGGATMPILVVSGALARATDRVRVLVLGATDLMRKPVQKFELRMKVESLLHYSHQGIESDFGTQDVEELLGDGTTMRSLDEPQFVARVDRTCRFSEEYGLTSVLVPFEASSKARRDKLLEAAEQTLRTEDAVLALPGGKRGIFLLVSTEAGVVPTILSRIAAGMPKPRKNMRPNRYAIRAAEPLDEVKDWDPYFENLEAWPLPPEDR